MEFDEVVRERRSVRGFSGKASWKDVLEAIDAAIQGPFAGNQNNFNFLIVEDKGAIREMAAICEQSWISQASVLIVLCSDETNLENMYGERGRIFTKQQAGAVIQTLMLKLTDLGLGSCWVGAYSDELIRRKLNIPTNIQIEAVIPVGMSVGGDKKVKKKLENVLYWEKWKKIRRPSKFREPKEDPFPKL